MENLILTGDTKIKRERGIERITYLVTSCKYFRRKIRNSKKANYTELYKGKEDVESCNHLRPEMTGTIEEYGL